MVKIFHVNGNKNGVATPISDKIDFKIKTGTRDKEGEYIMIKDQSKKNINIYVPNRKAPRHIRQMLTTTNGETNSNTIILWYSTYTNEQIIQTEIRKGRL